MYIQTLLWEVNGAWHRIEIMILFISNDFVLKHLKIESIIGSKVGGKKNFFLLSAGKNKQKNSIWGVMIHQFFGKSM